MEIERITEGLRLCKDGFCEDCPYRQYTINCRDHLIEDAFNLVIAQRKANHSITKIEKEKRRKLWQKAVKEFADRLRKKKDIEFYHDVECGTVQYETVDVEEINKIESEMIGQIKE